MNCSKTQFWSTFISSNWIKIEFSKSLSITWLWIVQKLNFDPPSLVRTGSKLSFRTVWKRIKIRFSNKLSHVIINFEEKSGGSKLSLHAYASRDSPPSHTLLDQNLDPRVLILASKWSNSNLSRRNVVVSKSWRNARYLEI